MKIGKKNLNSVSTLLKIILSVVYWFLTEEINYEVYPISFLSGISLSISWNIGLSIISDLVGKYGKLGAIVFGIYGSFDNLGEWFLIFLVTSS